MFREIKEYLKYYRSTAKALSSELKKDKLLVPFVVSFNTNFCQFLCGYFFGIINLHHVKEKPNYFVVYTQSIVLNNIIQNKNFENPFCQIKDTDFNIYNHIDPALTEIINILNLNEFINKTESLINQISLFINNTQIEPFDFDLLITNITTWIVYLLINDKLTNSEIDSEHTVNLWIEQLTILTSLITEQLKKLIGPGFGLILEFISNIVLSI